MVQRPQKTQTKAVVIPKNDERVMVEQWRESALAEQRHRREDREKIRLEAASKDRQMEEMASSQMKPEGVCPCGKHKGVAFMNGSIRLNPTLLCPLSVWLFWQKKGVVNSDWKQVLSERPIDEMLNNFRLGG